MSPENLDPYDDDPGTPNDHVDRFEGLLRESAGLQYQLFCTRKAVPS
jgi:hypothetical protein